MFNWNGLFTLVRHSKYVVCMQVCTTRGSEISIPSTKSKTHFLSKYQQLSLRWLIWVTLPPVCVSPPTCASKYQTGKTHFKVRKIPNSCNAACADHCGTPEREHLVAYFINVLMEDYSCCHYCSNLIFIALAIVFIGHDNTVFIKVVAKIWKHSDIITPN